MLLFTILKYYYLQSDCICKSCLSDILLSQQYTVNEGTCCHKYYLTLCYRSIGQVLLNFIPAKRQISFKENPTCEILTKKEQVVVDSSVFLHHSHVPSVPSSRCEVAVHLTRYGQREFSTGDLPFGRGHRCGILGKAMGEDDQRVLRAYFIMIFGEEADTEETLTCLHMTFYHPCQEDKMMFRCLNFCEREQVSAHESATFGRDSNMCRYNLMDSRVSRIQFSLQFYRKLDTSEFCFEIKNMSKKTKLRVDHTELGYLNKIDLPWKCLICFGDYQILTEMQEGQSMDYYQTCFHLAQMPLLQERCLPTLQPVPETGTFASWSFSQDKSPKEMDENEPY